MSVLEVKGNVVRVKGLDMRHPYLCIKSYLEGRLAREG
jgi:hypothetical protein